MRVLVTGAGGFVGRALVSHLSSEGFDVVAATRKGEGTHEVAVGDIGPDTDWNPALTACQVVVHTAARVHRMKEGAMAGLTEARRVNTAGTLQLARQAAACGVRRFIFLSSVKVNGEAGAFSVATKCLPQDAYGISKHEAELGLAEIAASSGMQLIVLRLPLVYGPGVGANFLRLMNLVERGVPLPLGGVRNKRSMLYLCNLTDAIRACLETPLSANRTWYVSDGLDVSTADLIRMLSTAMGLQSHLIPVPSWLLRLGARVLGKAAAAQRLLGSLTVDSAPLRTELGWQAPYSMEQGLQVTANWYLRTRTAGSAEEEAPATTIDGMR